MRRRGVCHVVPPAGWRRWSAPARCASLVRWPTSTPCAPIDGPPVAVLHLEGAEAIDPGLEALEHWYAAGLRRSAGVEPHERVRATASRSCSRRAPTRAGADRRRPRARAALRGAGILVDLSHLNEQGFWDVARAEPGPLVATHSAAHALRPPRATSPTPSSTRSGLRRLVGIVFACQFLRPDFADDADTPLAVIAQHATYVAERIGVDHVALGSDFDGARSRRRWATWPGCRGCSMRCADAGFNEAELRGDRVGQLAPRARRLVV